MITIPKSNKVFLFGIDGKNQNKKQCFLKIVFIKYNKEICLCIYIHKSPFCSTDKF